MIHLKSNGPKFAVTSSSTAQTPPGSLARNDARVQPVRHCNWVHLGWLRSFGGVENGLQDVIKTMCFCFLFKVFVCQIGVFLFLSSSLMRKMLVFHVLSSLSRCSVGFLVPFYPLIPRNLRSLPPSQL